MNYEKRYKDALERASKLREQNPFDTKVSQMVDHIFPELVGSEYEKMKKAIIHILYENYTDVAIIKGVEIAEIVAWLEKQKPIDEEELKKGALKYVAWKFMSWLDEEILEDEMCLSNAECKVIEDAFLREDWTSISRYMQEKLEKREINNFKVIPGLYKCVHRMFDGTPEGRLLFEVGHVYRCLAKNPRAEFEVSCGHCVYLIDPVVRKHFIPLEEQGKQKTADKAEPKFKVGDWIISQGGECYQIKSIYNVDGGYYIATDKDGEDNRICFSTANEYFHLWTIQDAKDGDVLVNGSNIFIFHFNNDTRLFGYCHVNTNNGRFYDDIGRYECFCLIDGVVNPATKEQCDTLFTKMKEAGYVWDADKKKPKKIVSKTLDINQIKKQDEQKFTDVEQKFHKGDYEDGIYLCYEDGYKNPFPTPFGTDVETTDHGQVTHLGIKVGKHFVGLKLKSLGEHRLPYNSSLSSDDFDYKEQELYALDDYDGEANTDHLKRQGELEFDLNDDEWIPALGELAIIFKNKKKINEALAFIGGDELADDWYWSSTEYNAFYAWGVHFSIGHVGRLIKSGSIVVRPVCEF